MVEFHVTATAQVPVGRAWSVLTDWEAHGRWVPLTGVRTTRARTATDHGEFVATTRLGPFRLIDRMTVTSWSPPTTRPASSGRVELRKLGPHLAGGAVLELVPGPNGVTRLDWYEDARPASSTLAHLAGAADAVIRPVARRIFARVLARAVREMEEQG